MVQVQAGSGSLRTYTIGQLAELAEASLQWDPRQPLLRYLGAVRQLVKESKVYMLEREYDRSFVLAVRVHKLATELIPNRHPDYASLPPDAKRQLYKDAEVIERQLSELRRILYARSEGGGSQSSIRSVSPSPSLASTKSAPPLSGPPPPASVAPGSTVALTLKNTVQPSSNTMSDNASLPTKFVPFGPVSVAKEGRGAKLKRRLLGGKNKPSSLESLPSSRLAEPGADVLPEEEDGDWTVVDDRKREWEEDEPEKAVQPAPIVPRQVPQSSTAPLIQLPPDQHPYYPQSEPPRQRRISKSMPLPGEEEEEEPEGLESFRAHQLYPWPSPTSSHNQHQRPNQQQWPTYPNSKHNHHIQYAPPAHLSSSQNWNAPNPSHQGHPSAPSAPPQSWPSHLSNSSFPSAPLLRSPSRLTVNHQQQQGFTPSSSLSHSPSSLHGSSTPSATLPSAYIVQPPVGFPTSASITLNAAQAPFGSQGSTSPQAHLTQPWTFSTASAPPSQPGRPRPPHPPTPPQPPKLPIPPRTSHAPSAPSAPSVPPVYPPFNGSRAANPLVRSSSISALPIGLSNRTRTKKSGLSGMSALTEVLEEELTLTEGGQPLRHMLLPLELLNTFVQRASTNTNKGIETCGLLLGTLAHNTFRITHLLIPKQEGTPDTCTTTHEEEQVAFQDERDLMCLGWIHTHPTQSCFLSSLDLHTHASYQVMLAESIAIVCSPNHQPSFGIFRCTDPPGLETIILCNETSTFHPHPDLPLYTDTDNGHVILRSQLPFECCDLRK